MFERMISSLGMKKVDRLIPLMRWYCSTMEYSPPLSAKPASQKRIIADLSREGLFPLLYPVLRDLGYLHSSIVKGSDKVYLDLFNRRMHRISAIHELIDDFNDLSLPWLTVKGDLFADRYYPKSGFRPCGDLDILVERRDFDSFSELLERKNFRPADRSPLSPHLKARMFIHNGAKPLAVHLHHNLINSSWPGYRNLSTISPDCLANRSMISTDRGPLPTLDPARLLFYLCFHAVKHGIDRLLLLFDLHFVLLRTVADDEAMAGFWRMADDFRLQSLFCFVITYTSDRLDQDYGTAVPSPSSTRRSLGQAIYQTIIANDFRIDHLDLLLRFSLEPSRMDRISLAAAVLAHVLRKASTPKGDRISCFGPR